MSLVWIKLAGVLALLAMLVGYHELQLHKARLDGYEDCQREYAKLAEERRAANEVSRVRKLDAVADIDRKNADAMARLSASAASDRAMVERLRSQLQASASGASAPNPSAPGGANAERATVFAELLGESFALVAESREVVGRLERKIEGLQEYAARVCVNGAKERPEP